VTTPGTAVTRPGVSSGISISFIALQSCTFEDRAFVKLVEQAGSLETPPDQSDEVTLRAKVRVYVDGGKRGAYLHLMISAEPDAQPTWTASVAVVAHFTASENSLVPLDQFIWSNGIANVVPYVRERLASLTSASVYPTFNLPPISVPALLALAGIVADPATRESQGEVAKSARKKRKAQTKKKSRARG
jgi:preprotein translocase subunit SecB